jgi:hypothetical protein
LPLLQPEPATEKSTYEARILKPRGVHEMDPNVYVYTPEFAKRFQMPQEWASADLQGADAVAFRVMPTYRSCGWGGNPNACREDEVRCEMDMYFDHGRNPLPWDDRVRSVETDTYKTSVWFFGSNVLARPKGSLIATYRHPFTDPKTGKELGWQTAGSISIGWTGTRSYDREIFRGVSLVTLGVGCEVVRAAWLAAEPLREKQLSAGEAHRFISLPVAWQTRVKKALYESDERSKAFFKQEGEKAMRELKEKPVQSIPITPLQ